MVTAQKLQNYVVTLTLIGPHPKSGLSEIFLYTKSMFKLMMLPQSILQLLCLQTDRQVKILTDRQERDNYAEVEMMNYNNN